MHRLLVILSTMFTFRPPAPGIQSSPVHIQGPALPQVPHLSHPPGKILLAKIGQSFRRFKTIRARRRRRVVLGFWADLDRLEMALQGSSKLQPDKQVCLPAPGKLWYGPLFTFCLGHQKKVTWMCPMFSIQWGWALFSWDLEKMSPWTNPDFYGANLGVKRCVSNQA